MRHAVAAALGLALAASAAARDFEGIVESRITVKAKGEAERGSGTMRLLVSGKGARMETEMTTPMGHMKMTMLQLKARPGVSFAINESTRSYTETKIHAGGHGREEPGKVTVKKLGPERVAGHDCVHALVTDEQGEQSELWVTKELGGAETFWAAQLGEEGQGGERGRAMAKGLRDAGLDGWPLKVVSRPRDGEEVVWETVKVERKSLPSSLFSLSGYKKVEHGSPAMNQMQLSPEMQKRMDAAAKQRQERMKKMSPEQRKQLEELMRSMKNGK